MMHLEEVNGAQSTEQSGCAKCRGSSVVGCNVCLGTKSFGVRATRRRLAVGATIRRVEEMPHKTRLKERAAVAARADSRSWRDGVQSGIREWRRPACTEASCQPGQRLLSCCEGSRVGWLHHHLCSAPVHAASGAASAQVLDLDPPQRTWAGPRAECGPYLAEPPPRPASRASNLATAGSHSVFTLL